MCPSAPPSRTTISGWHPHVSRRRTNKKRAFFRNVVLVVMMSPRRFKLIYSLVQHYCAAFKYMVFLGPSNANVPKPPDRRGLYNGLPRTLRILGFNVAKRGSEQYRALRSYMRMFFVPK
eukprot:PhM_4_TR7531/c0_g1_i1/m.28148